MKHKIGETAGKIWMLLEAKGELNITQVPKLLREKSMVIYQAIGWLAREDKIEFRKDATKIWISLAESEKKKKSG
jgi:hypothetical protein